MNQVLHRFPSGKDRSVASSKSLFEPCYPYRPGGNLHQFGLQETWIEWRLAAPLPAAPAPYPCRADLGKNWHLGNYSSIYYTYMWDKVIAEDFFQQFDQKHLMDGKTSMRYRHSVLEPGGSMSANDLVKNFLGRPQNTEAFQKWLGEEFCDAMRLCIDV